MSDPKNDGDNVLVAALRSALVELDAASLEPHLDPHVVFGDCVGPQHIMSMVRDLAAAGVAVQSHQIEALVDRIVVSIQAALGDDPLDMVVAVFHVGERIVEIRDAGSIEVARSLERAGPFEMPPDGTRARLKRLAPVLPVADVEAAVEHYRSLGFSAEIYDGGSFYAYVQRDGLELHLTRVDDLDPATTTSALYLWVDDARALFAEWRDAGAATSQGRLIAPSDTDYGLCEGAHIDPWGNLLRFGSPLG